MSRIDIVRLRKNSGLSQRKLAELLEIRPSFLSAIENGRSRLPEDKLEKVKSIFKDTNLSEYVVDELSEQKVPPHTHINDHGDSLTQLLNHFHALAHQQFGDASGKEDELRNRISRLSDRNDRLSDRVDQLRDEVDALREENLKLKEMLFKYGVTYAE